MNVSLEHLNSKVTLGSLGLTILKVWRMIKVIIHKPCGEQFYGTEIEIWAGFGMVGIFFIMLTQFEKPSINLKSA